VENRNIQTVSIERYYIVVKIVQFSIYMSVNQSFLILNTLNTYNRSIVHTQKDLTIFLVHEEPSYNVLPKDDLKHYS